MYSRNIEPRLKRALADTPVVLLHGARQTGKTTLMKEVASHKPERAYVTFDDASLLSAATRDALGFIRSLGEYAILDEVQKAPELFSAIKMEVDRARNPGRFLLTGSANILLVPRISESLAGRIEIVPMWPLSQGEIEGRVERFPDMAFAEKFPEKEVNASGSAASKKDIGLIARVVRGGYPEPVQRAEEDRRKAWFDSYLATILQRDIRDLANVEGLNEFPRLLALLATRTAGLLNYSDISRTLSIPLSTLKRYMAMLETTFLVVTIPAWASNRGLRLAKAPKLMISDTGLGCHLASVNSTQLGTDGALRGAMIENFVAMELIKQSTWSKLTPKLFHFRTVAGKEVDLVLEDASGRVVGIEVKASATVRSSDFSGLSALAEATKEKFVRGIVLYGGEQTIGFGRGMWAMPLKAIWGG